MLEIRKTTSYRTKKIFLVLGVLILVLFDLPDFQIKGRSDFDPKDVLRRFLNWVFEAK